eukprot:8644362-Karenia_brevis.AAC.1
MDEFQAALMSMKHNKAADTDNVVVEMIQFGSTLLHESILNEFNKALHSGDFEDSWHTTLFIMLPKTGNLEEVGNWRPIAVLPILYKVFSKMLFNRIYNILDPHQSHDQVGFRKGAWLEDALSVFESVSNLATEFNMDIWIASMDLRKAFDRIELNALFDGLRKHGLPDSYINLFKALYANQVGHVEGSAPFAIKRGVKQGDIVSPILFNCVIEVAFERWKRKLRSHGFLLPDNSRLTNSRYADDMLLYGKSLSEVSDMMEILLRELRAIGLEMNSKKTKILSNDLEHSIGDHSQFIEIDGEFVEILPWHAHHRYLGRMINLGSRNRRSYEIRNRKKCAWAAFHKFKFILLNPHISLRSRLKLFDACISPVMLFALGTLPMTKSDIAGIGIVQRKMMRRIIGWRRIESEMLGNYA